MSEQNLAEDYDFDGMGDEADPLKDADVHPFDGKNDENEDKPAPRGYMSKEAWIEAGKDPNDWVSPEVFKERGERIKMKMDLQRDFDNRIRNLNLLHQKQLEVQRQDILSKRDEAIDTADKDAVKRFDKQLKELDDLENLSKSDEQNVVVKPPEVEEWERDNPWCNDPSDPRLPLAQRTYAAAINAGKSPTLALIAVEKALADKFIDPKRKPAQIAEGSRGGSGGKNDSAKVTMSNLTEMERKVWESGIFDNQKEFLKAVEDDRKAGKK